MRRGFDGGTLTITITITTVTTKTITVMQCEQVLMTMEVDCPPDDTFSWW